MIEQQQQQLLRNQVGGDVILTGGTDDDRSAPIRREVLEGHLAPKVILSPRC